VVSVRETAPPPSSDSVRQVIEQAIGALFETLHHVAPPSPLDPRSRLDADLGFDSLARVELLIWNDLSTYPERSSGPAL